MANTTPFVVTAKGAEASGRKAGDTVNLCTGCSSKAVRRREVKKPAQARSQIEAVARGARPAEVLESGWTPPPGKTITAGGETLTVPLDTDPQRCPDCGGDRALRTGLTWCGAVPGTPCSDHEGEPHQDDMINAKIKAHPYRYRRRR